MKFRTGRIPHLIASLSVGLLLAGSANAQTVWAQGAAPIATIDNMPLNVTAMNLGTRGPSLVPTSGFDANGFFDVNQLGTMALSGSPWLSNPNLTMNQSSLSILSTGQLHSVGPATWDSSRPFGVEAFNQAVPPSPTSAIPNSVASLSSPSLSTHLAQQAARPSIAVARPDFSYVAAKREFEKMLNSSTTGQKDLGVGSGIPAGHRKFIPVGEF